MLTLILGRAGTGKTSYIFGEIKKNIENKESGSILIVPEQYSHDAERELAAICPDDASLYAEVLSFSRLANRVFAETGGLADKMLDKGGRVLAMSRAIDDVRDYLKVCRFGSRKPDFLTSLLSTYDELRSACAETSSIQEASEKADGEFSNKLSDLALIFDSYERVKEKSGLDTRDKLQRLCDGIGSSSFGSKGKVYIDGFTDFTVQEKRIIDEFLKKDCDITICLGCDRLDNTEQIFSLPSSTARGLLSMAARRRIHTDVRLFEEADSKSDALKYLERNLFNYASLPFEGGTSQLELWTAGDIYEECSFAAARVLQLVREGCRFRDIAVVAPDWGKYSSIASGVFQRFEIPVNETDKVDTLEKPVICYVISALDIIMNNWTYSDVFKYIKTGLTGISFEDSDLIENYVIKWNIRGSKQWTRQEPWAMHPQGYSASLSEKDSEDLERINAVRNVIAAPIRLLTEDLKNAETAVEKAQAIYDFLEATELYSKLDAKVREFTLRGELRLAQEYSQLWDILTNALTQFADILGLSVISNDELVKLLKLALGQYEIATIPASVDSVGVGDMSRMRRRGIKHLILLGATDNALPSFAKSAGILSDDEKLILRSYGIELPDPEDDTISRELGLIYLSLTMPSESITLSYPSSSRKSYIVSRLEKLFSLKEKFVTDEIYLEAAKPCFELAAADFDSSEAGKAARNYFESSDEWGDKLESLKLAASMPRGRLTRLTAEKLYGKNLNVSASRIDKYYSCKFAYFLQYGLKLKARKSASLDAPESGTFMHYILERATREADKKGGFSFVSNSELSEMAKKYTKEYADTKLGGLDDKSGRFKYLFMRLSSDAERVLINMADELRGSKFSPLDFELRFANNEELPPIEVRDDTGVTRVNGIVDRVDGWVHNGKLYLRVVDYKTGRKSFSLSDVYNGMGIQMLIYLFALCKEGEERYHSPIEPAGVLYAPARDPLTSAKYDLDDDELEKAKKSLLKRSGLLLNDPEVIDAMKGTTDGYLPVKFGKDGSISGDSLASLEQLGILSNHIEMTIREMAKEIKQGYVSADPYFVAQQDNACIYCDYFDACHFKDGYGGDRVRYITKLSTPKAWLKMEEENNGRN